MLIKLTIILLMFLIIFCAAFISWIHNNPKDFDTQEKLYKADIEKSNKYGTFVKLLGYNFILLILSIVLSIVFW